MTGDDLRGDPVLQVLRHGAMHDVAPGRSDDIRQRCHRALARRAGTRTSAPRPTPIGLRRLVEPALVAGVSAIYLAEVVRRALQLYGI